MKTILTLILFAVSTQAADRGWRLPEERIVVPPGPGSELVSTQCITCHSPDYMAIQPSLNRATWTATVTKMKDKYGAPIPAEQVEAVVNYLVKTYGTEKSPADKAPKKS
ncbi:MAG TPA: cytochrome c [Verrucomicrobiae bacterium]|nr:cytochrome c [Verrucomicrobiae bacterium]